MSRQSPSPVRVELIRVAWSPVWRLKATALPPERQESPSAKLEKGLPSKKEQSLTAKAFSMCVEPLVLIWSPAFPRATVRRTVIVAPSPWT